MWPIASSLCVQVKLNPIFFSAWKGKKDNVIVWTNLVPMALEYSAKNDKFRLQGMVGHKHVTLNLGKIITVKVREPEGFIELIKDRLRQQQGLGIQAKG